MFREALLENQNILSENTSHSINLTFVLLVQVVFECRTGSLLLLQAEEGKHKVNKKIKKNTSYNHDCGMCNILCII